MQQYSMNRCVSPVCFLIKAAHCLQFSSELKNPPLPAKLIELSDVVFDSWRLAKRSYPLLPKPLQCKLSLLRLEACFTMVRTIFQMVSFICELADPMKFIESDLRLLHLAARFSRC